MPTIKTEWIDLIQTSVGGNETKRVKLDCWRASIISVPGVSPGFSINGAVFLGSANASFFVGGVSFSLGGAMHRGVPVNMDDEIEVTIVELKGTGTIKRGSLVLVKEYVIPDRLGPDSKSYEHEASGKVYRPANASAGPVRPSGGPIGPTRGGSGYGGNVERRSPSRRDS